MEDMEKLLSSMTKMKDGMEAMQKELGSHCEKYDKDGIHVEVKGDGVIQNLKFAEKTPASAVEKAINEANAKVKDHISKRMAEVTPPELRERQ